MLDFVYNRSKIVEVMAEDALATMDLLEKVKADTKHLGSLAELETESNPSAFLIRSF